MELNEVQKQAVAHTEGPLLILAGAGSGKTTVLIERMAQMIENGVSPERILAVAFTNKAANEMKNRLAAKIGTETAQKLSISTFHAFCIQVLREEGYRTGKIYNDFKIASTAGTRQILKGVIERLASPRPVDGTETVEESQRKKDWNAFFTAANVSKHIALFKSEMIACDNISMKGFDKPSIDKEKAVKFVQEIGQAHIQPFVAIYQAYQQQLVRFNQCDLEDILFYTAELLLEDEEVRTRFQEKHHYLMVDEYQDTNQAQYVSIRELARKRRNLAVVGDDSQSIYQFRGSDIRNILQFETEYPEALSIKLEVNYRSTKTILEAANQIISHNTEKKEKTLTTSNAQGEKIQYFTADLSTEEAERIADLVEELVAGGRSYQDIAVFYRNNSDSSSLERILKKRDIPFSLSRDGGFFEQPEVIDILSYLHFLTDTTHVGKLKRILNTPKRGIGKASMEKIIDQAAGGDLLAVINQVDQLDRIPSKAKEGLRQFAAVIEHLQSRVGTCAIADLLQETIQETRYEETFEGLEASLKRTKQRNLSKLIDEAKEMEYFLPVTLRVFLQEVTKKDIDSLTLDDEAWNEVSLTTIHSAKGMEFPVVFILGMKEPGFPSAYSFTPEAIEEERRLCYVAFTRAKEQLYVSHPLHQLGEKDSNGEREKITVIPSRFLREFDEKYIENI